MSAARAEIVVGAAPARVWAVLLEQGRWLPASSVEAAGEGASTRIVVEEDGYVTDVELAHGAGAWRLALRSLKHVAEMAP